jgi:phosphatidylinositol glycan class S
MVQEDGDVMASEAKSAKPATVAKRRQLATHINVSNDTRLWNILSYLFILLVGIPYWWHTTSIERRPLPNNQVEGANMPVRMSKQ